MKRIILRYWYALPVLLALSMLFLEKVYRVEGWMR